MNKFYSILFIVATSTVIFALDPQEIKAQMVKIVTDCKSSSGATDNDAVFLMTHKKPPRHEGQCMFSCVLENIGVLKDGKLYKEGIQAWEKSMGLPTIVDNAISECSGMTAADPCEAATDTGLCFQKIAMKVGAFKDGM